MQNHEFDDIRPYYDAEIPEAMKRLSESTYLPLLSSFVFPHRELEDVRQELLTYKSIRDFQYGVMYHANKQIIQRSTTEFSCDGMEHVSQDSNYLYVSNHRDIMLDASLLQLVLTDHHHDTCEITFGANLMQGQEVIDVGKSNKMFKVARPGGSVKEFYQASLHLSQYIRTTITERHQSVWIAQRNGRTKDGIDRTDQGIIKMFGMSGKGSKAMALAQLNIAPVAVSYEWEPCDMLKTLELYARMQGPYVKKAGEDLNSILTGILQPKGKVHFHVCAPLTEEDLTPYENLLPNEFNKQVATLIDQRICTAYRLMPNNYVAHDLRTGSNHYADLYTDQQKSDFLTHMSQLDQYAGTCDVKALRDILLGIYANPVESMNLFSQVQ